MNQQSKWVKRPTIRPDDSGAAATLSRSPVSWAAAARIVSRVEREESTRELPIIDATPDGTGEIEFDDVLAIELLPGRGPTVSVSATCERQAEDVLDVLPLLETVPAPASVAPPPWVVDTFSDPLELRVSAPMAPRRQLGIWIAAAAAAASLGVILAAGAVHASSATALVLPRSVRHVTAHLRAVDRVHAHGSQIPVVSLASLGR